MKKLILFLFLTGSCWCWSFDLDRYQYLFTYDQVVDKLDRYLVKDDAIQEDLGLYEDRLEVGEYTLYFGDRGVVDSFKKPVGLEGARIALDPGHIGGEYAVMERRSMGKFCEGDLNYWTARVLKGMLEEAGAEVFVTRSGLGQGAIESAWEDLCGDLRARGDLINQFDPHLTICIHYNAHRGPNGLMTEDNFNLAFVPGAFIGGELDHPEWQLDFLRLLVTDQIEQSILLSHCVMEAMVEGTGVGLIDRNEPTSYLERACIFIDEGVYARNLALTRRVESPICYGESLLMTNTDEFDRLSERDTCFEGMWIPSRVCDVAKSYFEGIKHYLNCSAD
ncbi:MAG: hypothetical protein S4CHLAM102_02560 [Chlamydiia bacterium]|nr:hypothetical protein [Chlamydiia bacterium]